MHKICTVVILACSVAYVYAAAAIYPPEEKPPEFACQNGCYIKSLGRVLEYEVPYYPEGKCEQFTCGRDNFTYYVSCGVIAVQPGCRVARDLTKKYPDCCNGPVICDATTSTEATTLTTDATASSTESTTLPTDATTPPIESTTLPTDATTSQTESTTLPTEDTITTTEASTTISSSTADAPCGGS